ncbi:kinesin-like protein KIF15-A [Aricia agestis]|uniref:kinesin-like protein KIF15-A n=1 Tax=Aricia agestis TaxID=91739 RepID=UPI001C2020D7|nr:kinesin-like protein KIF15-A [Aricia agestis]
MSDSSQKPEGGSGETASSTNTAQDNSPAVESQPQPQPPPTDVKLEEKTEDGVEKVEESAEAVAAGQPAEVIQSGLKVDKENWEKKQQDLLRIIEDLRAKAKDEKSEESLRAELKVREEQIDLLKTRVSNLETKLEAVLAKPAGKNHEMIENIKQQHEELLTKARGMIFDKTKVVKNQELQIEALSSQVQSLKDVNTITKDLLEIRNSEVKAMDERLQVMESRFKAEKERYDLVLKRAQTSNNINDDLRKEYETQLAIFKELREKYEQRVQALNAENERLKAAAGTSA